MFDWSVESLESEAKDEIIKNMILAYPGHFIMPWTLYFLTDIAEINPWVFSIFTIVSLFNSTFHFMMGLAYPLFRNALGQKRWDKFYILTICLEALSFVAPVLYFQSHYGLWTQETLFAALLWVIGL